MCDSNSWLITGSTGNNAPEWLIKEGCSRLVGSDGQVMQATSSASSIERRRDGLTNITLQEEPPGMEPTGRFHTVKQADIYLIRQPYYRGKQHRRD